jgi:hypothetical protein
LIGVLFSYPTVRWSVLMLSCISLANLYHYY